MKFLLKILLKFEYKKHINTWHNIKDCIFCHMKSMDSKKFIKGLK